ncbi:MAG: hypothetical protein JXA21_25345 [Anaerolineae bacterium]|nr:hypothetical protein [Anaerolineae bacterium]
MGPQDNPPKPGKAPSGADDLDSLLEGVSFDEPLEEPSSNPLTDLLGRFRKQEPPAGTPAPKEAAPAQAKAAKKPRQSAPKKRKGGMAGWQKLTLIVLSALVLIISSVIGLIVYRMARNIAKPPATPAIEIVVMGTPQSWKGDEVTPVASNAGEESVPVTPSPTPTPLPFVSPTKYDDEIRQNPNNAALRIQRGNEYLGVYAYQAALLDFEQAVTLEKENAEAYAGLGQAYFMLHRWGEAESAYSTAISFNEDLPDVHFNLGMLYYYRAQYAEAAREFDWAAEINPEFVEAECWLAIAAAQAGDASESQAAAERAYELNDKLPLVYIARSWARRAQRSPDLDNALADLLHAQDLKPYDFEVLYTLARFYMEFRPERMVEAEQLANYAVDWAQQSDVNHARALHTLGQIYLSQGRKTEARNALNKAADLVMSDGRIALPGLSEDLEKTFAP